MEQTLSKYYEAEVASIDSPSHHLIESWNRVVKGGPRRISEAEHDEALLEAWRFIFQRGVDEIKIEVLNDLSTVHRGATVVRTLVPDCRFILDSVKNVLQEQGIDTLFSLHPIYSVTRDAEGNIQRLGPPVEFEGVNESFIQIELPRLPDDRLGGLRDKLRHTIDQVRQVNTDFRAMSSRLSEIIDYFDSREGRKRGLRANYSVDDVVHFLEWLMEDNFVFLGYRKYDMFAVNDESYIAAETQSGLGILFDNNRSSLHDPVRIDQLPSFYQERIQSYRSIIIDKTNRNTVIHRRGPMDYVGVRIFDDEGNVTTEHRFVGLFTRKAIFEEAGLISSLQPKLRRLVRLAKVVEKSHDYRNLRTVFNNLPKEDLFFSSEEEIHDVIDEILAGIQRKQVRVLLRPSHSHRMISLLVTLPMDYYSVEALESIKVHLGRALSAEVAVYREMRTHSDFAIVHYSVVRPDGENGKIDMDDLERSVSRMIQPWADQLALLIAERHNASDTSALQMKYQHAFDLEYQSKHSAEEAIRDVQYIERIHHGSTFELSFLPQDIAERRILNTMGSDDPAHLLRVYSPTRLILSQVIPKLTNFGFEVINEDSDMVFGEALAAVYVHTYTLRGPRGRLVPRHILDSILVSAIRGVFLGQIGDGHLNALMTSTGMSVNEVEIFRCYYNYYFQVIRLMTRKTGYQALLEAPQLVRLLLQYFENRFDPEIQDPKIRDEHAELLENQINENLADVQNESHYEVLRAFVVMIKATVRTNYYVVLDRGGFSENPALAMAIKIESAKIPFMPQPRPMVEIYVHGANMEGIHLRGGKVARGGIRWSDRLDDFRVEILGLMKTQMPKNTVIVPVGAKGGFVIHNRAHDAQSNSSEAQYRVFITALLSVTDNIVEGSVAHPEKVICFDGEDPYLVVAADKGTARFSDTANEISLAHDFWLGDAFASGGSNGYDHKEEGITAKGAFVCLERHFHEMGQDPYEDEWTCVGIGDMSGDVFGNGMLLSKKIQLVGAFNHRNIFIDPNPDVEASWIERKRLFEMPGSTWQDYNRELISAGGDVYPRNSRSIPLSNEARERLGIKKEALSGDELVRALLKAPVDVLYNGGIGTYVKASDESHEQCGDKANDRVRVDASDLRCKMIGEGGNLGMTQAARVEYAMHDGRINTDFIDNSAGVDMSDHEVNLKILLKQAMINQNMSMELRNQNLREIEPQVMDLVLADNRMQTLSISVDMMRSSAAMDRFVDLMESLERRGFLNRSAEFLPDPRDLIVQRAEGKGWVRPQLAILMAYEKMRAFKYILESDLPDQAYCERFLYEYFPEQIRERFPRAIQSHRLRREIIATVISNHIVNCGGMTLLYEVGRDSGYTYDEIAQGYLLIEAVLDIPSLRQKIIALEGKASMTGLYKMWRRIERIMKLSVTWLLRRHRINQLNHDLIQEVQADVVAYSELMGRHDMANENERFGRMRDAYREAGIPEDVCNAMMHLERMQHVFVVRDLMRRTGQPLELCHKAFYELGVALQVEVLRSLLNDMTINDLWDQITHLKKHEEITENQYLVAQRVLANPETGVDHFIKELGPAWAHYKNLIRLVRTEPLRNFHPFTVIVGSMRGMAR